ncbi:MAG: FtsX-like permease family protein [Candidatus Latescibacterota bacterium]|nr:FtsX-like permease family protein [Candidatus Latescibacterota bacterium]
MAAAGLHAERDETVARLTHTIRELSSHGARHPGYPGDRFAASYVEREFIAAGVTKVKREPYELVMPIDKGASLQLLSVAGEAVEDVPITSMWPNLVRTNTLGPEGLEAELFYGSTGEYEDFNGFEVEGNVVLMEFNSWANWKNAAALGAAAIIFIAPEETTLWEARHKWSWAPVRVPRFWLDRNTGLTLKARIGRGSLPVRMHARMDFEKATSWNIWGIVPGTDPVLKDEVVLVEAYYDGTSVVPSVSPSAEAASSISVLLELARHLQAQPPGRTVALLAAGSNFQGYRGLFEWFDKHARKVAPFKDRMPKRFIADSLDVETLIAATAARGITPDTLGIELVENEQNGQLRLDSVNMPKLRAALKLRRIKPDSVDIGIRIEPDSLDIALFIGLELSSKSNQVGVVHSARLPAHRQFFVPLGRRFMQYAEVAAAELKRESTALVNLISPIKGLSWDSYLDDDVYREPGKIAVDAGLMALNLVTTTDKRMVLDTPLDTADKVDFGNLALQSEIINSALQQALDDPDLFGSDPAQLRKDHNKNILDVFVAIDGRLRLLPRRSAEPKDPVDNALVWIRKLGHRSNMWRPRLEIADEYGNYKSRGLSKRPTQLHSYKMDLETGEITHATDHGERAQAIGAWEQTLGKAETAWTTIMFPAESIEIYDRVHAHFHFAMGNFSKEMKVLDRRGATPRQYGFAMGDVDEQMMLLFAGLEDSLRVVSESMILLGNEGTTDETTGQGRGFGFAGNRMVRHSMLQSTKDMWRLDEARIERMREFAIENPRLEALHDRAARSIEKADQAITDLNWGDYIRHAREAIGLEFGAYPDVRGTQNDVMNGLVFFMALLVPAAFFAERLIFASTDVRRQLAMFGAITAVIWLIMSQVHPAFELAQPIIVLLALMVIVMAFFVISLVMSRFNEFMTELSQTRSGTASGEISRSGTAYVAFMLGISNMRRRVMRTSLTLATITLLTFTVLSFTSFRPQIQFVGFLKDWKPAYHGLLMHDIHWWSWEPTHFDYLNDHFGAHGVVVPRTWDIMGFEEDGFIPLRHDGLEAGALGLLGMDRREPQVTGIDQALVAGSWFEKEFEGSVILADAMAERLQITSEEVEAAERGEQAAPKVQIHGRWWDVRGIYDSQVLESIRDLNNQPMTPAKEQFEQFNMPGMDVMFLMNEMMLFEADVDIGYEHQAAARLAILPYRELESMGAELMSVAVRFDDDTDAEALIQSYLSRAAFRLFVGMPDDEGELRTFAYTAFGSTSAEGFGALVIPMLIAALIVLNTMMGAVYERFREIGVYSSVGLAPIHIAFLFIAEACVYGVLGVVIGYIVGQVGAKILLALNMLGGVSLNYSSTSAVAGAMLVMLVVIVSTLYPSRVASQMAVPDVVRRWQLPDPDGDVWQFSFPFTVNVNAIESLCGYLYTLFSSHGHESVGKMYTEKTRIVVEETDQIKVYSVQLLLWLAPFDMGVSQYLQFTTMPTQDPSIHEIDLYIERISGPLAFWKRLNLGFMLELRKQFLVWQTLRDDIQQRHTETCRHVAQRADDLGFADGEAAG